jgi:hypothetical protein
VGPEIIPPKASVVRRMAVRRFMVESKTIEDDERRSETIKDVDITETIHGTESAASRERRQ